MRKTTKVVALDIHKESTTVALAGSDRKEAGLDGDISSTGEAISKLVDKLGGSSALLRFCYEAGPCGYGVYRQLTAMGHECTVVAPSLIPRRPGDRIKTDRRDALALARLHRNGELTAVWVPDQEQEAMRDLERCREDMTHSERRVRQRLNSFLQRHSRIFSGRSRWTQAHFRWLETQRFDHPFQQIVFQEYVDAVQQAQARVKGLDKELQQALEGWSLEPETRGMMALRGVDTLTAVTTMAELGDITRFDAPRQLMAFVGLVPSEHSSGNHRQRGELPRPAMRTSAASWPKRLGVIGFQPARQRPCSGGPKRRHPGCKRSPGKRRNGCVDGIVISRRAGCRRTRLVPLSRGSCWVSSGPLPGN